MTKACGRTFTRFTQIIRPVRGKRCDEGIAKFSVVNLFKARDFNAKVPLNKPEQADRKAQLNAQRKSVAFRGLNPMNRPPLGTMVYWRPKGYVSFRFGYCTYIPGSHDLVRMGPWNGNDQDGPVVKSSEIEWEEYHR